ncbi:hypothetical protein ACEXQE_09110 [Herbiconiux sp. P17]|uniref:hypothetical protein n=1 Tax=Herbiconiux wuyangfengii TaxID=3342794 RepID=UPI0035B92FF5
MSDTRQSAGRDGSLSRRGLLTAGAWGVPVVVLAVAAPAASASGSDPVLTPFGPIGVDPNTQVFGLSLSNLPDIPPSGESDYEGILIDFCLPEGLAILSVSEGWAFVGALDDIYEGGDGYVYNTGAIDAGTDVSVEVTVGLDPALTSLEGILGADVSVTSAYFGLVAWNYLYGTSTGTILPNCAAPQNRR